MRQTTPPPILGFFRSVLALPVLSFYTNGQAALSLSARALAGIRGDSERSRAAPVGDLGTSVLPESSLPAQARGAHVSHLA